MRKILSSILLIFMLVTLLCACDDSSGDMSDISIPRNESIESTDPTESFVPTESDNADHSSSSDFSEPDEIDPFAPIEITDDRITTTDGGKTFNEIGISVTVPANWKCLELIGEDGGSFFFRHPELGEKCELCFGITFSYYVNERTESEFLEYISDYSNYTDVKIDSFTKEKLKGNECTKIVASFTQNGENFIRVDYEYLVIGSRYYSFTLTYPASQRDYFEPVFESILNSIEFKTLK